MDSTTPERPAILQIVPALDTGGAERTTVDIAKALVAAGYRALVISEGGLLEREIIAAGGQMIHMPVASKKPFRILKNASAIATLIKEQNAALIHARSRAPAWSALIAARRTGIPFVTTYHGIYNAKGYFKRWYNSVMARGDAVIANSEWTAQHIRSQYSFPLKRLTPIPRGIELDVFDPGGVSPERVEVMRDRWGAKDEDFVVLLPGRLTRWKGQHVFIRALSELKRHGELPKNVRAVIAGSAQGRHGYVREIMESIARYNLDDVVVVSGHVTDMPAAYLAADLVVSASTDPEAFGRIAPEAAAMERPVIATDHGGARETVLPGASGLLIEPNNSPALAKAMREIFRRSPEELAAMGAAGRAHIIANYSVERMCNETLALYRELIAENSAER